MDFPTRYHKHHRPTIVSEIIHLTTTTTTTTIAASPILTTLTILTTTTTTSLPSPSPQLLKIIKAGEPSLINPGAVYIRAASLFNNKNKTSSSIIVGYAAPHPQNPRWKSLLTSISNDGGLSWQYRGQVTHTQNPFSSNQKKDRPFSQDIDNSFILQLPSGRLLYAFRNHDMRRKKGSSWKPEYFRITICASDDNGLEWFYLSQVDQNVASVRGGEKNGIWEPFLRLGLKGEVQVYYSEEKLENRQENVMRYSHDGGKTWSEEKIIVSDGPDFWPIGWYGISKDGMIGVTQRGKEPGKLIAVFQSTYYRGVFSITGIESDDDGYTWRKKDRKRIYTAPNGKHAGAPQVINLGGGKALVVSFMSSEHTMQGKPADWDGWIDGGELMLIVSFDEGKTWSGNGKSQEWQMGMMTVDKGCHWPGLYALNEDEFLVLYTKDGLGGVSQRFKLVPVQRTEKRGLGDELSATSKIISAST
ncbi:Sialidase [Podospora fimiseda]|uniref:Sialidase n=1 Tax=Podospora fimiseda TaxID=252190 RepID=A0AAN7BD82_9PEZI|nr:Sialidase [Podospora fimiseda]